MRRNLRWAGTVLALGCAALSADPALAQFFDTSPRYGPQRDLIEAATRIIVIALATGAGFALGWLGSPEAQPFRRAAQAILGALAVMAVLFDGLGLGWSMAALLSALGFAAGLGFWLGKGLQSFAMPPTTFGSAQWAEADELMDKNLLGQDGIVLGGVPVGLSDEALTYPGERHLLTVAPTRSGKGVSHLVPNLLTYSGSVLVIDPKGENAMITAAAREAMGQEVLLVDPWGIATAQTGHRAARFNPLEWLQLGDIDITENAMILADAIVQPQSGEADPFWREESKALIQGLLMHVAVDEGFAGKRHLGTVRDLLLLSGPELKTLFQAMVKSPHQVVASTGARCLQKEEKLLSNVLASAQAETHMLDSTRLREALSVSDFAFEDLKSKPMSVYLILPADRLETFSRFLRLLVQQAITVCARDIAAKPDKPVLFILDEMAALGRLSMVEQAYGLMAGFGLQLWGVVQDLCQLRRVYGEDYESFIANSGAVAYFGSPDKRSAEYFSGLCGEATVWNFSTALATAFTSGFQSSSTTETHTDTRAASQRKLAYPDELRRMPSDHQLVLIEDTNPILAHKRRWFEDPALKAKGVTLHR